MITALLTFLVAVPAGIIALYPMKNQLRWGLPVTYLLMGGTFLLTLPLMSFVGMHFDLAPNTVLFPMLGGFFLAYHSCTKVPFVKSLSVFLSVMALMAILGMYASYLDAMVHPDLNPDIYSREYALAHLAMALLAALVLAYPLSHFGSYLIDQLDSPPTWFWTLPFSVLFLLFSVMIRPRTYETLFVNRVGEALLYVTTFLLVLWLFLHLIFYFIVKGVLESSKIREEKKILEMQESQFLAQQRYIQETSRQRHDFRHSIRTLTHLYEDGDYEAIGGYLRQYEKSQPYREFQDFCKNPALNALINHYVNQALQEGILVQIETRLPERLPCSDIDICHLVGNLMENAIAGASRASDKWVHLSFLQMHESELYLVVTNSFDGQVRISNGRYLSTKHKGNGLGLASIEQIANSLGGMAQFRHQGTEFYTNVVLPL